MQLFNLLLVTPLTNILIALYHGFVLLGIPYALAFSIIGLSVLIRLALYPITASQLKMSKKMQEINPHLNDLKTKHKDDPKRLQQETMQLYAKHGVNPLAGCLPMILQFVVLIGLFQVIKDVSNDPQTVIKHLNSLVYFPELRLTSNWETTFFGLPLVKQPAQLFSTWGPVIVLIPILTGLFQFLQSAMMAPATPAQPKKEKSDEPAADMTAAMQTNMMYVLPFTIGIFAWNAPIALALYWNTFSIFGIIQQYRIAGPGKLGKWLGLTKATTEVTPAVIEGTVISTPDRPTKKKKRNRR